MEQGAQRSGDPESSDAERLRAHADRIEQLLQEVEASAGPSTWGRVQELMHRVVDLYGAGLDRVLRHATASGVTVPELQSRLVADEVVSSLLILHGLHPVPTAKRIEQALEKVQPYLRSHAGGVELIGIDERGVARLRLVGTCQGCPSSSATVDRMIRQAVEDAAPEISGVEVESAPSARGSTRPSERLNWIPVFGVESLTAEGRRVLEVAGVRMLVLRTGEAPVAFRSDCPGCARSLDEAQRAGDVLTCAHCGAQYDLARAGQAMGATPRGLEPLPLLAENGVLRVGLPGGAT